MEIRTETFSRKDDRFLQDELEGRYHSFKILAAIIIIIVVVLFFLPEAFLQLLPPLSTKSHHKRTDLNDLDFGLLFFEIGLINFLLFCILPAIVILMLKYYSSRIPKIEVDLVQRQKEVIILKVKGIKPFTKQEIEDCSFLADHSIIYEDNPLGYTSSSFLASKKPECLTAVFCKIEKAQVSRIELNREYLPSAEANK